MTRRPAWTPTDPRGRPIGPPGPFWPAVDRARLAGDGSRVLDDRGTPCAVIEDGRPHSADWPLMNLRRPRGR